VAGARRSAWRRERVRRPASPYSTRSSTCIAASNNINLKTKVPTYKKQQRNGYTHE
jgi:hypothetical protein